MMRDLGVILKSTLNPKTHLGTSKGKQNAWSHLPFFKSFQKCDWTDDSVLYIGAAGSGIWHNCVEFSSEIPMKRA